MSKPLYAYLRGIPSTPALLFNVCVPVCVACIHNQRRISAFFLCGSLAFYLEMGSLIEPEIFYLGWASWSTSSENLSISVSQCLGYRQTQPCLEFHRSLYLENKVSYLLSHPPNHCICWLDVYVDRDNAWKPF